MKHLGLIAIITILLLASCSKNKEYCWVCTAEEVETNQDGSTETTVMHRHTYCGYTEDGIKEFEYENYIGSTALIQTCEKE